jgi:Mn-containing catalase
MYYHDNRLQYPVRVDKPNPLFARMLQQAIGGVEGEIRVMMQYLFQAWGSRGPQKYRDMLLETGTEEIGHIEMLATAVALNLEGAPVSLRDEAAASSAAVEAVLGGMNLRHVLSTGLAATPENANGIPFNASHVYASGNIAADMYANVTAESSGRVLATRLWEATDDPGMKDMLSFLIARDTMHQNQWLAVIEELGGLTAVHPIPNSFPQSEENGEFSYAFMSTLRAPDGHPPTGRWTSGRSIDGKGEFTRTAPFEPLGDVPQLAAPDPRGHAQMEQMTGGGLLDKAKRLVTSK